MLNLNKGPDATIPDDYHNESKRYCVTCGISRLDYIVQLEYTYFESTQQYESADPGDTKTNKLEIRIWTNNETQYGTQTEMTGKLGGHWRLTLELQAFFNYYAQGRPCHHYERRAH